MEASTTSSFLLLFLSAALFSSQVGAQKDGPTIGFISPDVVSDIGKSLKIRNSHWGKESVFVRRFRVSVTYNISIPQCLRDL